MSQVFALKSQVKTGKSRVPFLVPNESLLCYVHQYLWLHRGAMQVGYTVMSIHTCEHCW